MADWKTYKLGDLIEFLTKGTTPTTLGGKFTSEGINFIKSEAIGYDGRIDRSTFVFIDLKTHEKLKRSQLQKDDILFSMAGIFLGKNAIVTEDILPANTNQALAIIRLTKDKTSSKYVHYYLRQPDVIKYINGMSGQSAQPNINFEEIKSIEIKMPEISAQNEIVSILSSFDNKIELNLQMNQTLEALVQAIFKEWFVKFNFPGFDGTLVDGLPRGWRKQLFREQFDVERGISYKGSGLTDNMEGIPMNNLNSVYEGGGYKYEGIKYYKGEHKEKHIVQPGDIIITNTEQGHKHLLIGFPAIVPEYYGNETIFSHHLYRIRPKQSSYLTSQYIYYLIMLPEIRDQIIGCSNGTTVNMLKVDGLEMPEFAMPNKEIISQFSDLIKPIWRKKENNFVENQTLIKTRDILLPKLMSGKLKKIK